MGPNVRVCGRLGGRVTDVILVRSCTRDGRGGSPTAVVVEHARPGSEDALDDVTRRALAGRAPASHTAFIKVPDIGTEPIGVRFFTRLGELSGCGHGTIAVHAYLASAGLAPVERSRLSIGGRTVEVTGTRVGDEIEAWVDHSGVTTAPASTRLAADIRSALTMTDDPAGRAPAFGVDAVIANPGAPRLLLAVVDRATLATLRPDPAALATACRRHGLLGCFVHVTERRPSGYVGAARMFAPAIGIDEDVANANSTAGLAVALAAATRSVCRLVLDQGDALGAPSTVRAEAVPPSDEASGTVRTGGRARVESR